VGSILCKLIIISHGSSTNQKNASTEEGLTHGEGEI
jgi:hypothetical protein